MKVHILSAVFNDSVIGNVVFADRWNVNSYSFSDTVTNEIVPALFRIFGEAGWRLQLDNATAHTAMDA